MFFSCIDAYCTVIMSLEQPQRLFVTADPNGSYEASVIENESSIHPSKLNYIIIDSKKALAIPALMFAFGVFGNGLAIASLLLYKYKRLRLNSPQTCSSFCAPPSNLRQNHLGEEMTRRASTARNKNDVNPYKRRRGRNKFGAFHTLVLVLISVDLVGNIATSPVTLFLYSTNTTIQAAGGDALCKYSAFAMMFFGIVTMTSLTTMAVERVLSIQCPYFYHRHISKKTANIAVLIIVISCAIFAALPVVGFGKIRPMFPYTWCFADWQAVEPKDMAFNYIYAITGIILISTTLICNITVVVGLFKMKCRISSGKPRKSFIRRETQMIIQLVVMTFIYLICWLPLLIRILDNQLTRKTSGEKDRIAIWLAATNPILDPWVYILLRRSVVKRLAKFANSCFPRVHNKLRIVVYQASPRNNNSNTHNVVFTKDAEPCLSPCDPSPRNSLPVPDQLEPAYFRDTRDISASCESLYDNALAKT